MHDQPIPSSASIAAALTVCLVFALGGASAWLVGRTHRVSALDNGGIAVALFALLASIIPAIVMIYRAALSLWEVVL